MRRKAMTLVLSMLFGPALWNLAAVSWMHWRNPIPGVMYPVAGRDMHLYCTGSGTPTVILEAAASATWLAWRRVQPQLSPLTQVCSYDRAGHGWSAPRPGPRDADHIVDELHQLLDGSGIKRPLVLVGHSAGGLYVREFIRRFPSEVSGAALLDSSSPRQLDTLPGFRALYERNRRDYAAGLTWQKLRVWSGWERLTGGCRADASGESPELAGQYAALMCRPAFVGGEDNEYPYFEDTSRQAGRLTSVDVPLLIVSRDPEAEPDRSSESVAQERAWGQEQEAAKALTSRSWRVIARGSGHGVHHDRLDLVVAELTRLLAYVRGGPAPPFGSTTVK